MQSLIKCTVLFSLGLASYTTQAQDILYAQSGGSIFLQPNADVYVEGNVTLAAGSSLSNQGKLYVNRNTATGIANWLDQTTGSYSYGTGTVVFNSTVTQTATSPNRFGTIEVRNAGFFLGSTIQSQNWLLHSGIVHTGTFMAVALNNAGLAVDATAANPNFTQSWFNGTLRRYIQPSTVNTYVFPVGNATQVNRAELDNLTTTPINASYIDASFKPKTGTDANMFTVGDGVIYTVTNNGGVWNLIPDVSSLTGKYDLRLYFNGFTGLADNLFGIVERTPPGSIDGSDWIVPTGSFIPLVNQPGRVIANGFARRNRMNILGQVGIAQSSTIALPIILLDFNAVRQNPQQVGLSWKTSSEESNGSFHIERKTSTETTFNTVAILPTTYNGSGFKEYHLIDPNTDAGKSWYRLKLIGQTGNVTYSTIKIVNGIATTLGTVSIAPNPNRGTFSIIVKETKANQAFLTDAKGSLVKTFQFQANTPVNITGLSAGVYFLNIPHFFEDGTSFQEKIVVLH